MQFLLSKIHSFENNKNLREALFMTLTLVRDKHKLFTKEFTKQWLVQNNTDLNRILNEPILLGLLDYNLVVLEDIDKFISTLIKKQAAASAVGGSILSPLIGAGVKKFKGEKIESAVGVEDVLEWYDYVRKVDTGANSGHAERIEIRKQTQRTAFDVWSACIAKESLLRLTHHRLRWCVREQRVSCRIYALKR